MRRTFATLFVSLLPSLPALAASACGGSAPPEAAAPTPTASPLAEPTAPTAGEPEEPAAASEPLVSPLEEAKAGKVLGPAAGKLAQIAKLSPKTHKSLLNSDLVAPVGECKNLPLVDVTPAPGLVVAEGKKVQVHQKALEKLKQAGAVAKQRGMLLEVTAGARSLEEAVLEHDREIIEAALEAVKAAPAGERKEKSYAKEARKALGLEGPRSWDASTCSKGPVAGKVVHVQLVAQDASGGRGEVMVKADAEPFTKETFEATYWEKKKGKPFRMLSEIMTAGNFVRTCPLPHEFTMTDEEYGTWRCKLGSESWDPENRPIPSWQ